MSHSHLLRGRRTLALVASLSLATAGLSTAATSASAADPGTATSFTDGRYVVLLADTPAAAYEGGVPGLERTRPAEGRSYAKGSASARKYEKFLDDKQDAVLRRVGARATYRYTVAANGFAAQLTAEQAAELAGTRGVLAVTKDEERSVDTTTSPEFLGLSGTSGTWAGLGGAEDAGDGVVVGIVDTGIWPESASFAGKPMSSGAAGTGEPRVTSESDAGQVVSFRKKDGSTFTGLCQAGEKWDAGDCNTKLISAQYFAKGFLANVAPENRASTEQISARDGDGHGSHTAGTAAGNAGVAVSIDGSSFGKASGVAPAAKVAAYKVCWSDTNPNTGGCYTSDSVAAIDQAVEDGVDVLNYSISGATSTVVDAVEYAFFNAAAAGVFVAASAGNSGPSASTVAHNSPWLTTVAASTHSRTEGTVVTGAGTKHKGASIIQSPLVATPVVLSSSVGAAGADPGNVKLCTAGSLSTAAAGKVVVCDRGVIARVDKSAEVKRVGGVGMVLANTSRSSLDSDVHTIPTVHVDEVAGAAIKSYVNTAGAQATVAFETGDTTGGSPTPVPQIAGFSSRGPALANGSDLLKPDISAPGVSVIAAVAPPAHGGRDFDVLSGTSMSSPHVAGLAALFFDRYPSWSPMMVKSAMMTTAYDLKGADGAAASDPFAQGAGHVDPRRFLDPGLVVTSTPADWAGFYAGQGLQLGTRKPFEAIAATDLNLPSIAVSKLAGTQTVSRTFTATRPGRYSISVDVPGFTASHRDTLPFSKAGQQQKLEVSFTRTTAPLTQWSKGFLTLKDGATTVRLPVALRPVAVAAPAEVSGTGTSGQVPVTVTSGFTGQLAVTAAGFAEGTRTAGRLAAGKSVESEVVLPAGTRFARFDVDAANDGGDFDLYVYRFDSTGTRLVALAGRSATGAADERVDLAAPVAAKYLVVVENYALAPGETTDSAYTATRYVIDGAASAGGLTVTPNPAAVTQGATTTLTASWSGLEAGAPYLGLLTYDGAPARTVVSVTG